MDQKFEIGTPLMRKFLPPLFSFFHFPQRERASAAEEETATNLIKLTIFEMGVEEMTPIRNRETLYYYYSYGVETITS